MIGRFSIPLRPLEHPSTYRCWRLMWLNARIERLTGCLAYMAGTGLSQMIFRTTPTLVTTRTHWPDLASNVSSVFTANACTNFGLRTSTGCRTQLVGRSSFLSHCCDMNVTCEPNGKTVKAWEWASKAD